MKTGNKLIKKRYIVIAILLLTLVLLYKFRPKVYIPLINAYTATYNRIVESRTRYELDYVTTYTYDCYGKDKDDPNCILTGGDPQYVYEHLYITKSGRVYSSPYTSGIFDCYSPIFKRLNYVKKINKHKIDKLMKDKEDACNITSLLVEEGIINENAECTSE